MAFTRSLALFAGTLLMTGCTTISVMHDYSPDTNFSGLRSWDWMPAEGRRIDLKVRDQAIEIQIRRTVIADLEAKGFVRETSGEPDFRVSYLLVLEEGLEAQTINEYGGGSWTYRQYGPQTTLNYAALEQIGNLIIDVYDVESRELIWRGAAQAKVHQGKDAEERHGLARDAVKKIMEPFPPGG